MMAGFVSWLKSPKRPRKRRQHTMAESTFQPNSLPPASTQTSGFGFFNVDVFEDPIKVTLRRYVNSLVLEKMIPCRHQADKVIRYISLIPGCTQYFDTLQK